MRVIQPEGRRGSLKWIQCLANRHAPIFEAQMRQAGALAAADKFEWLSPLKGDDWAEYRDDGVADAAANRLGARVGKLATLRLDERRTLVLGGARAWVAAAATEFDAAGAAVVRGATASLLGNRLHARGRTPAVVVNAAGDAMFCDNRVEQPDNRSTDAVRIASPVAVANGNRVRGGEVSLHVTSANARVAALGNVTSAGVRALGGPLPAPFDALNLIG